jgi:hypothetical protein
MFGGVTWTVAEFKERNNCIKTHGITTVPYSTCMGNIISINSQQNSFK